ncbi:MAG: histidinol dehydrogenase, partial [Gammaproteobacteria bacterium]
MTDLQMNRLDASSADFDRQLERLLAWNEAEDLDIHRQVIDIIADVRRRGDQAVIEYTNRFDRRQLDSADRMEMPKAALAEAWNNLHTDQARALQTAADRIRSYAEHQKIQSWSYTETDGTVLGQKITPLDRVGLYVPGGKAAYPSSVLMNAIPAKVAGVG